MPEVYRDARDWQRYRVDRLSRDRERFSPFSHVYHVTHLRTADSILTEGSIKPRLVYDESVINAERTEVVWFSPNEWRNRGYRYGNIRFQIPMSSLVEQFPFAYWVGAMEEYNPTALRILMTRDERLANGTIPLVEFDPTRRDGPWHFDRQRGQHFYHPDYTLELMIAGTIQLNAITRIDYVKHHPHMCSMTRRCPHFGRPGAGIFQSLAARLAWQGTQAGRQMATRAGQLTAFSVSAYQMLRDLPARLHTEFAGEVNAGTDLARALCRAVLGAFSLDKVDEASTLMAQFTSSDEFHEELREFVSDWLNVDEEMLELAEDRTFEGV